MCALRCLFWSMLFFPAILKQCISPDNISVALYFKWVQMSNLSFPSTPCCCRFSFLVSIPCQSFYNSGVEVYRYQYLKDETVVRSSSLYNNVSLQWELVALRGEHWTCLRSQSIVRQTNILLGLIFSWNLLTEKKKKDEISPALYFKLFPLCKLQEANLQTLAGFKKGVTCVRGLCLCCIY